MRSCSSLAVVAIVALAPAACGGKIADDPNAPRTGSPSPSSSATSDPPASTAAPSSPLAPDPAGFQSPTTSTVADACGAICKRNGDCGALQTDCLQRCTEDIQGAAACSAEANAYIHCYADNLAAESECTALPPVCEPAYCAYTRCAGKVVPSYCP